MSKKHTEEANFNLRGGYGGYYLFQEQRGGGNYLSWDQRSLTLD